MTNLKVIQVPDTVSIYAGNGGEIAMKTGTVGAPARVVTNLTYGGSFFGGGAATVELWEPASLPFPHTTGGVWRIRVGKNGVLTDCFYGFCDTSTAKRYAGGYLRTFNLVDLLTAWEVTLSDVLPHGATTENPSATYTLSDALSALVTVVSADDMSGIPLYGVLPTTSLLVQDMYEDKVLVISNSDYLSEIRKLGELFGLTVFQHPSRRAISVAKALNPGLGSFSMEPERFLEASFDRNYRTIPATVAVLDDATAKVSAYGFRGSPVDYTNFYLTGRNNLAYASVIGIADDQLVNVAKQTFDVARKGSSILSFTYAGMEPDKLLLGKTFDWADAEGAVGNYTASEFQVTLTHTSVTTTIGAYQTV